MSTALSALSTALAELWASLTAVRTLLLVGHAGALFAVWSVRT